MAPRRSLSPPDGSARAGLLSSCALAVGLLAACHPPANGETSAETNEAAPSAPSSSGPAGAASAQPSGHGVEGEGQEGAAPTQPSDLVPAPSDGAGQVRATQPRAASAAVDEKAKQLEAWAAERKGHAQLAVFDLESRTWLVEHRADEPTNPASTQKLLTAAAALELLGSAHVFRTEVLGRIEGDGIERLVLRGGGAPDLESRDWLQVAHVLHERGVTRVGKIVVDQSRFAESWVPPAFEQQPEEWAAFRAPVSALALDRNTVALRVLPGKEGETARVWFEPPGLVANTGTITTGKARAGDRVTWSLSPTAGRAELGSRVGGSLGADSSEVRYSRRLDDPRLAPGLALRELLREGGVKVPDQVTLGGAEGLPRLMHLDSQPLGSLIRALGKDSDNFTAEMLAIALSQADERGRTDEPWSTQRGLAVMSKWLKEHGLDSTALVLKNGSGLFDANRLTAHVLVRLLDYMFDRPSNSAEYMAQLARGGRDGTLRSRFVRGPLAGRIRAKTGTLRDTSALAGYVMRADGRRPLAFAFLLGGAAGRQDEARKRIDETLERLVALAGP
ncbi:MAG TPA: D-alanyl-D-alanine carboxypeptidase/D-alanyl-D-alanine-endopeptidase [Polyangiaceae bacterium]|nr:D-alanyl-D-alanine carboxypeptidase/D-alanyl-D-alanine-endopeptidase [Polyangiaceae bacterium]